MVAAALTAAYTAGCGAFPPPRVPAGMERQISQGERISAATQAHGPRPAAGLAAASAPSPGRARHLTGGQGHGSQAHGGQATRQVSGRQVTAIGDSVMLASALALRSALPSIYIDARPSRQMPAGLAVVRRLAASGQLRPVVVVGLGTNYLVTPGQLRELLRVAGPHRRLVLINTYENDGWSRQVNATDADFVQLHPGVVLADWYDTIKDRTGLLWPDQVHPELPGTAVYARMVYRAVQGTRGLPAPVSARQPAPAAQGPDSAAPSRCLAGRCGSR
ncbi:MAG: hypothetical protein LBI49_18520 [Nocardiopsaceae bacterium]|nr:hypothetical protein [Nocardiopsaceae bacterium]